MAICVDGELGRCTVLTRQLTRLSDSTGYAPILAAVKSFVGSYLAKLQCESSRLYAAISANLFQPQHRKASPQTTSPSRSTTRLLDWKRTSRRSLAAVPTVIPQARRRSAPTVSASDPLALPQLTSPLHSLPSRPLGDGHGRSSDRRDGRSHGTNSTIEGS